MINQLRHDACSGAIEDLAHVVSADCLSDCLTKTSAKPDALCKTVATGYLPNVDKNPPFRELMRTRHKAYSTGGPWDFVCTDELISWLVGNLSHVDEILTFLCIPVRYRIEQYLVSGYDADSWWTS